MYTAIIGKVFLDAYNEKYSTHFNALDFFNQVYYPLFYDHSKYMQWITNSPFVQMKSGQKEYTLSAEERKGKLNDLHEKIKDGFKDASVGIGYPSTDLSATTSGQVSNIAIDVTPEQLYLSWIGGSLGIGVAGGLSILLPNKEVLLELFEGWKLYRVLLENNDALKGHQMETWNGQWLTHRFSRSFNKSNPMAGFDPYAPSKNNEMTIAVQSWSKLLIALSLHFSETRITGYIYNLGQTNTTIGFIPIDLPSIRKPLDLYEQFFGMDGRAEKLWGTASGLKTVCKSGVIGTGAMEPKGLRDYIDNPKIPKYKEGDENQKITYQTYQIWILAMLNNQELWTKAQEFATALQMYVSKDKKTNTKRKNIVMQVVSSVNKKSFLSSLSAIVEDTDNQEPILDVAEVVNAMPTDNVPYFLTLIKFHYAAVENQKNKIILNV